MYMLLSSLTALCLHKLSEKHIWVTRLARNFNTLSAGFAGFWFWDLGGLSLWLFDYEIAMAKFLFLVAETKLCQFILWFL